ncbi:MAG TPA: MBL fold metallo-hydrolase [Pseudomonadales bacterium]|nr:MBL fold metallo-hydrolase [Pseudomonadales bacterium]
MRFASLGSGSRGNGTLVQAGETLLLVDCGFTLRETELRLMRLGVVAEQLRAVLVTHEHGDHCNGVRVLANRYRLPVYMTSGTARAKQLSDVVQVVKIDSHLPFAIDDVQIQPVAVPHDAAEPVQYIFEWAGKRLGVLTDLGAITPFVRDHYRSCDALLLESNHCVDMLARGSYPASLKMRVGGRFGHLNNAQAADLLHEIETERLQHLVIAHLSEKNNTLERVQAALHDAVQSARNVLYACQEQGFDWLTIH